MVQKIYSKMYLVSCTNTYRDVRDLVNHGIVKNAKTWISWQRNIFFLQNKKILNLCLKWHILRSYCFAVELTFEFVKLNLRSSEVQPGHRLSHVMNPRVLKRPMEDRVKQLILTKIKFFSLKKLNIHIWQHWEPNRRSLVSKWLYYLL